MEPLKLFYMMLVTLTERRGVEVGFKESAKRKKEKKKKKEGENRFH